MNMGANETVAVKEIQNFGLDGVSGSAQGMAVF
jgi:hypothetical protein